MKGMRRCLACLFVCAVARVEASAVASACKSVGERVSEWPLEDGCCHEVRGGDESERGSDPTGESMYVYEHA